MKKEYIKPFAWGMAVGAIALLIVGFSTGWVVTSSDAKTQARVSAAEAVIDRLAPISVAQFLSDPNGPERLVELRELDSWKRGEFVVAQGWATMPGEKDTDSGLAREVATRLMEIEN
jgi:hypothetical protein